MNFFDKLGKKATETYNATKEKTNQISGELKQKSKINDCRAKIDGEYKKLGKMIYDNRTNGDTASEDDIQAVCNKITELFKDIEQAEDEILKLRNIKKCENCGAEIDMTADFCPKCGTKQPKVVAVEVQNEPVNDANAIEVNEVQNTAEEGASNDSAQAEPVAENVTPEEQTSEATENNTTAENNEGTENN